MNAIRNVFRYFSGDKAASPALFRLEQRYAVWCYNSSKKWDNLSNFRWPNDTDATASVAFMVTAETRRALVDDLGYSPGEVGKMSPDTAVTLVRTGRTKQDAVALEFERLLSLPAVSLPSPFAHSNCYLRSHPYCLVPPTIRRRQARVEREASSFEAAPLLSTEEGSTVDLSPPTTRPASVEHVVEEAGREASHAEKDAPPCSEGASALAIVDSAPAIVDSAPAIVDSAPAIEDSAPAIEDFEEKSKS
jgi:hypothetical protein